MKDKYYFLSTGRTGTTLLSNRISTSLKINVSHQKKYSRRINILGNLAFLNKKIRNVANEEIIKKFGSEMKSLFAYGVPRNPDLSFLEIYLVLTHIPEPHTFYKNIKKLEAGHYLVVKEGRVNDYKYWDLPEIDESNMLNDRDYIYNEFETLFRDSIKIRMRSDVPFGAFLSGGLDSSSIVSVMSDISTNPINTFTIGFSENKFDESKLAALVAEKFHTQHHLGLVNPEDFNDFFNKIAFHYDEPFGDSSAIPTGYVSKFAREKVKMVLTGDGGDEVLSGYNSYLGIKISSLINKVPSPIQSSYLYLNNILARLVTGNARYKLNKIDNVIKTANLSFSDKIAQKAAYTDFENIKKLVGPVKNTISIEDYLSDFMKKTSYKDDFYKMMYFNFKSSLPNDYLVKVDRMSMANSLETRIPFLDFRLIEFMAKVDKNIKLQGWERKSILRKTIGKTLPQSLLKAPKKGFGIPLREWFKDELFADKISSNLVEVENIMDRDIIEDIVHENNKGLRDNGNFIWALMMLNKNLDA